jgi:transcriptional regulator with XRE-family HTH domain
MPRRTIVDPRFPARLRQLRTDRGLSLRDLVRLTYFGKSTLSELENGRKSPSAETAHHLDRALDAGGELAGMVTDAPDVTTPEDDARLSYKIGRPARSRTGHRRGTTSTTDADSRPGDNERPRCLRWSPGPLERSRFRAVAPGPPRGQNRAGSR